MVERAVADQRCFAGADCNDPGHWESGRAEHAFALAGMACAALDRVCAATYALTLGRHVPASPGPRLLVLRVFAHDRKQLRLLDELQSRWRYVGPVHQIGGPDLATTNVDPHECALSLWAGTSPVRARGCKPGAAE